MYYEKKGNLILFSLITLILLYVPFVKNILRSFQTMLHESGHAFVSMLTGAEIEKIELYSNTEGVTHSLVSSNWSSILISFSGYTFSSLVIVLTIYLIKHKLNKLLFSFFFLISLVNIIFWIRNLYGFIWISLFIILLGYIIFLKPKWVQNSLYVLATILIIDSTRSILDILFLSINQPGSAGDATNLSNILYISPIFFAAIFLTIHLFCLFFSFKIIKK